MRYSTFRSTLAQAACLLCALAFATPALAGNPMAMSLNLPQGSTVNLAPILADGVSMAQVTAVSQKSHGADLLALSSLVTQKHLTPSEAQYTIHSMLTYQSPPPSPSVPDSQSPIMNALGQEILQHGTSGAGAVPTSSATGTATPQTFGSSCTGNQEYVVAYRVKSSAYTWNSSDGYVTLPSSPVTNGYDSILVMYGAQALNYSEIDFGFWYTTTTTNTHGWEPFVNNGTAYQYGSSLPTTVGQVEVVAAITTNLITFQVYTYENGQWVLEQSDPWTESGYGLGNGEQLQMQTTIASPKVTADVNTDDGTQAKGVIWDGMTLDGSYYWTPSLSLAPVTYGTSTECATLTGQNYDSYYWYEVNIDFNVS